MSLIRRHAARTVEVQDQLGCADKSVGWRSAIDGRRAGGDAMKLNGMIRAHEPREKSYYNPFRSQRLSVYHRRPITPAPRFFINVLS
jgi:hypothetical protein